MSQQQPAPSLQQYPGYFPAAKPPFWTRTKVGVVAGVLGLFFGIAMSGASGSDSTDKPAPVASSTTSQADVQTQIDDAVAAAEQEMNDKLATAKTAAKDAARQRVADVRAQAATAQRRAVASAVARTRSQDQAKLRSAVAAAKASAPAPAAPAAPAAPSTDPRFSYCYEANDAGYGPYWQGQDPEYYWYEDGDNDGEVCE